MFSSAKTGKMEAGDYKIPCSHLHPGTPLKDLPSGYLAFIHDLMANGGLNQELKDNLEEYLHSEEARQKLERGRKVPLRVVVKGFNAEATRS